MAWEIRAETRLLPLNRNLINARLPNKPTRDCTNLSQSRLSCFVCHFSYCCWLIKKSLSFVHLLFVLCCRKRPVFQHKIVAAPWMLARFSFCISRTQREFSIITINYPFRAFPNDIWTGLRSLVIFVVGNKSVLII